MTDSFATAPGAGDHNGARVREPHRSRSRLVLVACGPGSVSLDHVIRLLARR